MFDVVNSVSMDYPDNSTVMRPKFCGMPFRYLNLSVPYKFREFQIEPMVYLNSADNDVLHKFYLLRKRRKKKYNKIEKSSDIFFNFNTEEYSR